MLPTIAVEVRRLHDVGRSGYWWWIRLIPVIGWVVLLVFYLMDSQPGTNAYGTNPKEPPPVDESNLEKLKKLKAQTMRGPG